MHGTIEIALDDASGAIVLPAGGAIVQVWIGWGTAPVGPTLPLEEDA